MMKYHDLIQITDEEFWKLPPMKGVPVYYRKEGENMIELWPTPDCSLTWGWRWK